MTAFQAAVYALVYGVAAVLPISLSAHELLLSYYTEWALPPSSLYSVIILSTAGASFFYFRHDWASILSSIFRTILFWKKPMTLDERMPLFQILLFLPVTLAWFTLTSFKLDESIISSPQLWLVCIFLILFSIPLLVTENLNRRMKKMADWNWWDSLIVGIFQAFALIPGAGRQALVFSASFFRNYQPEAIFKFVFITLTPWLALEGYFASQGSSILLRNANWPQIELGWLPLGIAAAVAFFSALLALGGLSRSFHIRGLKGYAYYRILLGGVTLVVMWINKDF